MSMLGAEGAVWSVQAVLRLQQPVHCACACCLAHMSLPRCTQAHSARLPLT
jgi:hypothetical protein